MDKREAKRHARRVLGEHARTLAQTGEPSPDGERLSGAYTELAQFLDPRPLVAPVDPDQLTLDVGVSPDSSGG